MKAFVLDPPRCTGCEACRVACAIENRIPMERAWRTVHHANPDHLAGLPAFHLSLACNHCARPACLEGCPASAYTKDPASGTVLLDDGRCIGCRYCAWVCPYDAPRFDAGRGLMAKCTFCIERLRSGGAPACAVACPTGALATEDLQAALPEPDFPGLFQGGLGPALRIAQTAMPLAPAMAPVCDADTMAWMTAVPAAAPPRKISLRSEWTLWLFTLTAMTLAGLHLGWTLGGPRLLPAWLFLTAGGLAAGFSLSHLGRPERAWRAIADLRSSWLSREILCFGAFLPCAAFAQHLGRSGAVAWTGAAAAIGMLVSMDRLYQAAERRPVWKPASADLLPAGLHLAVLVAGAVPPLAALAGLRAVLFAVRRSGPPFLAAVRLAMLAIPVILPVAGVPSPLWAALACFLVGEALDRAGYYDRLDIPSPSGLLEANGPRITPASADPA